jgi:hypothetical protein
MWITARIVSKHQPSTIIQPPTTSQPTSHPANQQPNPTSTVAAALAYQTTTFRLDCLIEILFNTDGIRVGGEPGQSAGENTAPHLNT